ESGARADQLRDDAVDGWRPVLAPFRSRLHLKKTGAKTEGKRPAEIYELTGDPGGGNDGGSSLGALAGTVELDLATGFPIAIDLHGSWESPAPERSQGRVGYDLDKLTCSLAAGDVKPIVAPESAQPAGSPSPAPTAKPTAPKATPKPTPKKKP